MRKIQHNEETTIEIVDTDLMIAVEKNPQNISTFSFSEYLKFENRFKYFR